MRALYGQAPPRGSSLGGDKIEPFDKLGLCAVAVGQQRLGRGFAAVGIQKPRRLAAVNIIIM